MSLRSAKLVNLTFGLRLKLALQIMLWSRQKTEAKSEMAHCFLKLLHIRKADACRALQFCGFLVVL